MANDVRIAVQIQNQHAGYQQIRDAVLRCEEAGVDILYNWDHFYPLGGDQDGKHFEAWTMLGAWAEQTERIELGCLVSCNSYRNPQLLADMARTVDHISQGRLILGIGSGWMEKDYLEYGYEFGTAAGRLRALDAALPLIRDRLAKLNPPPTRSIPILIGGGGEKVTLRIVAEYATVWHSFAGMDDIGRKLSVLDGWCERVGRDPAEIERSVGLPATRFELAEPYYDLGIRQFTFGFTADGDFSVLDPWLEWRDNKRTG
jgi:probable F420-dependent oxidoreductase